MITRTIAATTHGRYLVVPPASGGPAPMLVGFHGYAELAEAALERMQMIPGTANWLLVSIQGLHRFYRRLREERLRPARGAGRERGEAEPPSTSERGWGPASREVVASWMTRQDRELAIADNAAYVTSVVEAVAQEWTAAPTLVFTAFSQGVAMAYRAACASRRPVSAVVSLGGDVPPELERGDLSRIPRALIGRGERDEWYTVEKRDADVSRLRAAATSVETFDDDAAHEWTAAFSAAAGEFLNTMPKPRDDRS